MSSLNPISRGQVTSPSYSTVQHDSLALTVNPDTSVGVGWNTTSTPNTGTSPGNLPPTVLSSLRLALNTHTPILVVSSPSMCQRVNNPNTSACTLAVGDVILIRGVNPNLITNNSIIVFRPYSSNPKYLVVHRVIHVFPATPTSQVFFWTKGDANATNDSWDAVGGGIPGDSVVGVYQFTIPKPTAGSYLGTVHSSSSFSQKSNSVVQTTTSQYQLPAQLIQPPLSFIDSISLTDTKAGSTSQGSLRIATIFPISNVAITYHNTPSQIQLNASVLIYFSPLVQGTSLGFLSSQAAFQSKWSSTLGDMTWLHSLAARIEIATGHTLTVTILEAKLDSINTGSARFSIRFVGQNSAPMTSFGSSLDSILNSARPLAMGLGPIIRSAINLVTGESTTVTYTGSTHTILFQSTIIYVLNLDSQINKLKNQFFQLLLSNIPAGTTIPASVHFFESTSLVISQISATNDLNLSTGTSQTSLKGLVLKPPTVGSNTNFTIPGLFQTIGTIPAPGLNLTIVGGSNATYSVKIVVPASATQPSSKTANSVTWTNLRDASTLSEVRFTLQRSSSSNSFLDALTSPLGIALEAIAAVGAVTGAILYQRRRRSTPVLAPSATPTPGPTLGPGSAPVP
ncbi:MAG TPA: hypothetical protein VFE98_02215 [Candidatus Bathyarchaeia archaeon]|nr:hypothetical protein [Candidatus Bathyarchaeia archaeon]